MISGVLSLVVIAGMLVASAIFTGLVVYVGYLVLGNPGSSTESVARQSNREPAEDR